MTVTVMHKTEDLTLCTQERKAMAAAFRWAARLNMHEGIANHFSLRIDGIANKRLFLLNPRGRHFSTLKASDLLLLDCDDPHTLDQPNAPDRTAWAIHGAIHRQCAQAGCVMHVHSKYATVLASIKPSTLPPIDQNSMRFFERIAVDDGYDGMGLGDEAERLAGMLGNKSILVMGNHGVLVTGPNVARTFDELYYFERACETFITALMTGQELRIADDSIARKTMQQWLDYAHSGDEHFAELMRILDHEGSDYAS